MSFITDTSTQLNNALTPSDTFSTSATPNINFNSSSGIYNPSANVIKIFTNNTDALTIDANQYLTGNATGLTNLIYNAISSASKPDLTIYATNTNLNSLSLTVSGHTTSINSNTSSINGILKFIPSFKFFLYVPNLSSTPPS